MNTSRADAFGSFAPRPYLQRVIGLTRLMPDRWLGRRLAFAIRRIALKNLPAIVDIETFGVRFRLWTTDNVCEKRLLFTPQFFDAEELGILAGHIEQVASPYVFIDIGANVGAYALFVARRAKPGSVVIAVEPQPEVFARLTENIRHNTGMDVRPLAYAVADYDGEAKLYINHGNRGEASLKNLDSSGSQVTVPTRTLLSLANEHQLSHIDALKIDVEGVEDIILSAFFEHAPIALWPRLLIMEGGNGNWRMDLFGLLEQKGYRMARKTRLNFVLERDTTG